LLPSSGASIALMMQAASTFETSVNIYQTTRRNNPEDSRLHVPVAVDFVLSCEALCTLG
jgi:hypothetical protein